MKSTKQILRHVILAISIVVFLFSAYKIYTILSEYNRGDKEYKKIIEKVIEKEEVEITENGTIKKVEVFKVNFKALSKINPETVAWIRFADLEKINYPIVQASDNEKYLHTTFEGNQNKVGAIFLDSGQKEDFSEFNTFIYGHNMKDGSMFAGLRKYQKKEFAVDHPYFHIYTPDGKETTYQVFAVEVVSEDSKIYKTSYQDEKECSSYLEQIKENALYSMSVEVNSESKIVSLSTCTNVEETQRLLVHGVKISEKVIGE